MDSLEDSSSLDGREEATRGDRIRVLFLGASPLDRARVRVDAEVRRIQERLGRSARGRRVEFLYAPAAMASQLLQLLLEHDPHIVHISGHGECPDGDTDGHRGARGGDVERAGIVFEDEEGRSHPVTIDALAGLLARLDRSLRCVVLETCHSRSEVGVMAPHVDHVIAVAGTVSDAAAIGFAESFYGALCHGTGVRRAFELARADVDVLGIPGGASASFTLTTRDPGRERRGSASAVESGPKLEREPASTPRRIPETDIRFIRAVRWSRVLVVGVMILAMVTLVLSAGSGTMSRSEGPGRSDHDALVAGEMDGGLVHGPVAGAPGHGADATLAVVERSAEAPVAMPRQRAAVSRRARAGRRPVSTPLPGPDTATGRFYRVTLVVPSALRDAEFLVDGDRAVVTERTLQVVTLRVPEQRAMHEFAVVGEERTCRKQVLIRANDTEVLPCD